MDFAAILLDFHWHHGNHGLMVLKFIPHNAFLSPLFKLLNPENIKILTDNVVNGIRIREITVMNLDSILIWALICLFQDFLDFLRNGKLLLCTDSFSHEIIAFRAKISFNGLFDICFNGSGNDGLDVFGIGPVDLLLVGLTPFELVSVGDRRLVVLRWRDLKGRYCGMDDILGC